MEDIQYNEYQIPLFANYNKSIRENDLTMTFENLISLLYLYSIGDTSSTKFRHAFISVIRSFLFEIKDPKIADLVANSNYSDYEAYKLIEKTYIETKNESTMAAEPVVAYAAQSTSCVQKKVIMNKEDIIFQNFHLL